MSHEAKLRRLAELCEPHHYVGTCPLLFFLWHRDFSSLHQFFFLNHPLDPTPLPLEQFPPSSRAHFNEAWSRFVQWTEMLLSKSIQLRQFVRHEKEWIQESLHQTSPEKQQLTQYVITQLTSFPLEFISFYKKRQTDPFWSYVTQVDHKQFPYLSRCVHLIQKEQERMPPLS